MSQHTPGPWTVQPIGDETECNILSAHRDLIATVSDNDARLIAAAPEMLAALRTMTNALLWITDQSDAGRLDGIERLHKHGTVIETARDLLARIEGQS